MSTEATFDNRIDAHTAFTASLAWAAAQSGPAAIRLLEAWRDELDFSLTSVIAAAQAAGADAKKIDNMHNQQRTTRRQRRQAAERANVLNRNPELSEKVAAGELTPGHLDALAAADRKSENRASSDGTLLQRLSGSSVEQAGTRVDEWLAQAARNAELEERRAMQRRNRGVSRFRSRDGLQSLMISGDDETVDAMWKRLVADANRLYANDGGRDVPLGQHPRNNDQRLFDAAEARLLSTADGGAGANGPRPVVVVTASTLAGTGDTPAELIGTGPIPRSFLEQLACGSDFVGMVFGSRGQALWQGRRLRYPTVAQRLALLARDKACVLCGADAATCEAHHIIPFNAPAQGPTNIDNLVLVCGGCHRRLHERHETIKRTTNGWATRPAQASEVAPARPGARRSQGSAARAAPGPSVAPPSSRPTHGHKRRRTDRANPAPQQRPPEQPSLL